MSGASDADRDPPRFYTQGEAEKLTVVEMLGNTVAMAEFVASAGNLTALAYPAPGNGLLVALVPTSAHALAGMLGTIALAFRSSAEVEAFIEVLREATATKGNAP